jgi:hypothetical protein
MVGVPVRIEGDRERLERIAEMLIALFVSVRPLLNAIASKTFGWFAITASPGIGIIIANVLKD